MKILNTLRIIYHLALADFLERVRRQSYLLMLGLMVFLGFQIAIGNLTLNLGKYRGVFNSAWVGALMSINATFFIGWFGFYLVKGSITHDRKTGVGQILATTPLSRQLYLLGKWLSNFSVLITFIIILALEGLILHLWKGESNQITIYAYLASFLYIVLPYMALIAALAIFFETIPFLQGGLGNIIYFFSFLILMIFLMESLNSKYAVFEPLGFGIMQQDMGAVLKSINPDYDGDFSLGTTAGETIKTFVWNGINWTPVLILCRMSYFGLTVILVLLTALFFDRFDPSRSKLRIIKKPMPKSEPTEEKPENSTISTINLTSIIDLTPLAKNSFNFFNVLISEIKLLFKGQYWWWYIIAGILIIVSIFNKSENVRAFVLPLCWFWPVLIWSGLGNREMKYNTGQMVFSAPGPLLRQLPATWLAGFLITVLTGSGAALNLLINADSIGLLAWLSGALFIPTLALFLGVWSNNSKVFEVVYVALWYIGPLNNLPILDYLGAHNDGNLSFFLPLTGIMLILTFFGRGLYLTNPAKR